MRRSRSSRSRDLGFFAPYVPVAERRAQAAKAAAQAARDGQGYSPVVISGRNISTTFWGKAWCAHQESFSDFENRLPRGRSYVRNGSVIHLAISAGLIEAKVMGSGLYTATIRVKPLPAEKWAAIKKSCAGQIDSLVGLLQGRLSDAVMQRITDRDNGLFPSPYEANLNCSCPDSVRLCKHLSAVLYGVGARLDTQPELLFKLRGVDHLELIDSAAAAVALPTGEGAELGADELADVFGIEIGDAGPVATDSPSSGAATTVSPAAPVRIEKPSTIGGSTKPAAKAKPVAKPKPAVKKGGKDGRAITATTKPKTAPAKRGRPKSAK